MEKPSEENKDKQFLKDVIDCASEDKESSQQILDTAFGKKKILKKLANKKLKNESLKKGVNNVLDHEKVTKDLFDIALDDKEATKNVIDNIYDNKDSPKELMNIPLENENLTKKFIDKTFENKDEVKEIIDDTVEDKNIKKNINTVLEHEEVTKDITDQ